MVKTKIKIDEVVKTIAMTIFLSYVSVLPYILFREELQDYYSLFVALAISISFLGTVKLIQILFCGGKNGRDK